MLSVFKRKRTVPAYSKIGNDSEEELIPVSDEFAKSMAAVYDPSLVRERRIKPGDKPVVATIDGWVWLPNRNTK